MIKMWHVEVCEGEDGMMFLDLADQIDELGWDIGDTLIWIMKEDGTVHVQKKPSPNRSSS